MWTVLVIAVFVQPNSDITLVLLSVRIPILVTVVARGIIIVFVVLVPSLYRFL